MSQEIVDMVLREHEQRVEHVNREAFEDNVRQPPRKFGVASGFSMRKLRGRKRSSK